MGETTSHPLIYDATPASILPIVVVVAVLRFWGTPWGGVVAFAHICFP
jgi:hypothetical protein